jgi:osmotically-inducible protein OsmY
MKTDFQLQQDVLNELKWEPSINAAHIGVEAKDGVITLSGHVNSFTEKWNAERAAKRVAGVKVLAIDIEVNIPGSNKQSDTDIANAIRSAFKFSTYTYPDALKVEVDNGLVTLTGEVEWNYLKEAAEDTVRFIKGVKSVINLISIKPSLTAKNVKGDIEAALQRRAQSEADNIEVEVNGDEVTLRGNIHSWPERRLATSAVWSVAGVRKVVDKLNITY